MDCESRITVSKGHQVQLVFYAFETELGSDIVTLYDGAGDNKKEIVQLVTRFLELVNCESFL